MDEKSQSRQYWLRVLLALGLLWGTWLPVQLFEFVVTPGSFGSFFVALAAGINSLTIAPACFVAFWHRRAACVWLACNAIVVASSAIESIHQTHHYSGGMIFNTAGPVLLAICLITMELERWPGALDKDPN
jgi:hypothetical protein